MSRYLSGRLVAVDQRRIGRRLVADHPAGVTALTVNSTAPFDEDGGKVQINDEVLEYTSLNDETGELFLTRPLVTAGEEGDRVLVYDPLYERPALVMTAQVDIDEDDDADEPVEATVAHHLQKDVSPGLRGANDGESVLLDYDEDDDEWRVIDISGLDGRDGTGHQYEANDAYTLTADDIAAGSATVPLSHRPIEESLVAFWGVLPQEPTEYTVNHDAKTVTWPLDGFEQVGQRIWFHYAYLVAGAAPSVASLPFGSSGWKYLQVATTDATDRSGVAYDDSGFSTGTAPFSNNTTALGHPDTLTWLNPVTAAWAPDSDLWLRRTVAGGAAGHAVTVTTRIDNYVRGLYWNGELIDSYLGDALGELTFTIPGAKLAETNVIALRLGDDPGGGDRTYIDVHLEGAQ